MVKLFTGRSERKIFAGFKMYRFGLVNKRENGHGEKICVDGELRMCGTSYKIVKGQKDMKGTNFLDEVMKMP